MTAGPTVDAAAPPRPELPSAKLPSWTLLIPMIEIDDAVNAWADDARKGFGLSAKAGVEALAKMPSLDELRGRLVGLVQAPAAKLARVAQAPAGKVARVIQARADQLQQG